MNAVGLFRRNKNRRFLPARIGHDEAYFSQGDDDGVPRIEVGVSVNKCIYKGVPLVGREIGILHVGFLCLGCGAAEAARKDSHDRIMHCKRKDTLSH